MKGLEKCVRLVILGCLAGFASTAVGESDHEDAAMAQMMTRLAGYEWQIPSSPLPVENASAVLLQIASDEAVAGYIRNRAVATLSLYPTDSVWAYLTARIAEGGRVDRRRAVDVLCEGFLPRRSEQVTNLLGPLLAAEDPHLRARSAACLQRVETGAAGTMLEAYRRTISNDWEATAAGFDPGGTIAP